MQPQGYRGVRDENGIMRAVRDYPNLELAEVENLQPQPHLFIVTNSSMWEDDRFIFGMTSKDVMGLTNEYQVLGDVRVLLMAIVPLKPPELMVKLRNYRLPHILKDPGAKSRTLTNHVVLPLRNMSKVLGVAVPGFPSVKPLLELIGEDADEALRIFLRLYRGSKMGNRIYTQLHRHLRLLDEFMSHATFDQCMQNTGYHLDDQGIYEVPLLVPTARIEFNEKNEVRSFVKGSALSSS